MNIIDGLHLIVDGNVKDPGLFAEANLDSLFRKMVVTLDMDLIHGPVFKQVTIDPAKLTGDKFVDEGGISAYAMISTSHISIHCWPLRHTFMADIFSCKAFSHELAMNVIEEHLKPSGLKTRMILRRPDVVL